MKIQNIKGMCENCGFHYQGDVEMVEDKYFPVVKCAKCKQETSNFDDAETVGNNDASEGGEMPHYQRVEFEFESHNVVVGIL